MLAGNRLKLCVGASSQISTTLVIFYPEIFDENKKPFYQEYRQEVDMINNQSHFSSHFNFSRPYTNIKFE